MWTSCILQHTPLLISDGLYQQLNYSLHLVTSLAFIGTVEELERSVTLQQIPFIAELAERSPTIIQNSCNPSSPKNLDVRPYDRMPRLCLVVQWSGLWAPSRTTRVLDLAGARRCALKTCGEKNASSAFRLG